MPAYQLPSIDKIAEALGGDVTNGQVLARQTRQLNNARHVYIIPDNDAQGRKRRPRCA